MFQNSKKKIWISIFRVIENFIQGKMKVKQSEYLKF